MPSKKKKYNARFPPARIKKIMQKDEDVGKVAAPVPVLISKALEIFVEGLITKSSQHTLSRNAKTLTTSHIKQCIEQENKFDFLKELVENVPMISCEDEDSNHSGSFHSERHGNARRKHKIGRNESAQSSVQSVDDPSSDEESFTSDESSSKDEQQRNPPEDGNASSASLLHRSSYSVPPAQVDCNPYPVQHQASSGMVLPPATPPPLPLQHRALAGSTAAMGAYVVPHPHASQREDNGSDSDEDYDA